MNAPVLAAAILSTPSADVEVRVWQSFAQWRASGVAKELPEDHLSFFETLDWFENLERTCPVPHATTLLLSASDAHGTTLLPLRQRRLGAIESLSNFYGSLYGPVTTNPQSAARHAAGMAHWLQAHGCSALRLHPLSRDTPFWPMLAQALRQCGYWADEYFVFANWHHSCPGVSWSEYLAARPSRLRNTITRVRKKLRANANFTWRLVHARSETTELEAAVQDFCTVYDRSWKKPEPYTQFIPGLCRLAQARGWLRLGVGYLDGEPVTAQIWIVKSGVASIFKLAYDHQHAKQGVGTWLSAALTEHVLDVDRVHEIDFLAGDDPYKAEWMDERRERFGVIAFQPRSLRGLVSASLHFGVKHVRRILSRVQGARGQ